MDVWEVAFVEATYFIELMDTIRILSVGIEWYFCASKTLCVPYT